MFTFDSRIRYSETDSDGKLTIEALLDYFQDCSTFQSEDLGVGFAYLRQRNMIWVLSSWQVVVDDFPQVCDHVTIGTYPYDFKGCFGYRNFFMKDKEGNVLARANSLWTLLYMDSFGPAHPTEDMLHQYEMEPRMDMNYAGRKISVPEGASMMDSIIVQKQHLDTNHHVNNGQYVRMTMEYLPDRFVIRQMRAEYKKQAHLHDILYPYAVCKSGENNQDIWVISLRGEDDKVYVNVEFEGKIKE